jgi:ABC-type multidrug transport system fused ATPase/permease subunit
VAILAFLLLSSIGLQLLNPQILRRFIDAATQGGSDRTLTVAGILFIVVALLQQLFSVGATYLSENVGWSATNALRADLLAHCLRLDQSFHKSRTPGELIERIDGDVTALANFFSQFIVQVLGNALLLAGILAVLWTVDWRVGLLLTVFAAVVLLSLIGLQSYVVPSWKRARQASADLFGFLEERLAGTEDIRASGAQPYTMHGLYRRLTAHYWAERSGRLRSRSAWTTADLLFALGTGASFALGAYLFNAGSMTIGTIYSIFFYTGLLWHPLNMMAHQAEDLQKATAGMARVEELLAMRSTLVDGGSHLPSGPLPVSFEEVTFGYGDDEPVLDGITLRLGAGRILGVLGRTGSGKTTLTRLLFRLYDPQRGVIRLGDADIRAASLRDLRRRVGIVTQEVQLFHATVRDNLTFFDKRIPDERIMQAIHDLGLDPWFRTLPDGLDSMLSSGSGGLSAGQAQLLAFTRIFLRDPGLVILDEASSRLDPATEQLIERAVDKLLQNRTGIIIAHRLDTIHRAGEILILEHGKIREHGERERLLRDPNSRFNALLKTGIEEALA